MDQLQSMKVFVRVAQHLGFAAAARELRLSPAAVTKHVNALEAHVGARLFDRTTRRVGLTEAGGIYLERCHEALQALEDADASVAELAKDPKGVLRITAPSDSAGLLQPVLADMMLALPDLLIDLRLSNRVVDLVDEGVDVGVRVAPALDGRYVAKQVALTAVRSCAAPAYLERFGRPARPEDLERHRSVVFVEPRPMDHLVFARGKRKVRVALNVAMFCNFGATLMDCARDGVGVGVAPSFLMYPYVAAGQLEPLLDGWTILPELKVFAVYPHRRFLSAKVRVFLEALRARLGDGTTDPWR